VRQPAPAQGFARNSAPEEPIEAGYKSVLSFSCALPLIDVVNVLVRAAHIVSGATQVNSAGTLGVMECFRLRSPLDA
jgi:hypothetical protein